MAFSFADLRPVLEIALAMALGGVIGFERERADKPAGLRTHMLLAGASALLVGLGEVLIADFADERFGSLIRSDPLRIFEAIVTGIGILAAGTIFRRSDNHVEGLTTAASLLFVGGIGIAVAIGQLIVAVAATVLALVALRVLRAIEGRKPERHADDAARSVGTKAGGAGLPERDAG
jgi:putative Mg2+ transporter-C (MgtC) family protein